jgi:XTP/dITP diphosphohydrolase
MLTLATGNAHKVKELQAMLGIPVRGLGSFPDFPPVVEDGDSFEANAIKKAVALARHAGDWALADDSGLAVDALGGAPGIHSARYAGKHGDDAANNAKLLRELAPHADRSARFVCVLALSDARGTCLTYRGECQGRIAREATGAHGFGYDPLFVPEGYGQSFAELGPDIKGKISHRARALAKLLESWGGRLAGL